MHDPQIPDPLLVRDLGARPWDEFPLVADAAVRELSARVPMDLWLVTFVVGQDQQVIASHGVWGSLVPPGSLLPWANSFCIRMIDDGPGVAATVRAPPRYQEAAVGPYAAAVRCYVGVPLVDTGGLLFGSLCGFADTPRPAVLLEQSYEQVRFIGRMLSTVLAREVAAAERSRAVADARAQVDRDALTGLANFRGWQHALGVEEDRCRRFGSPVSIVTVSVEPGARPGPADSAAQAGAAADTIDPGGSGTAMTTQVMRCASELSALCRPTDTAARITTTRLAVVAVGADVVSARALVSRLRPRLRSSAVRALVDAASRRAGEDLTQTWQRAHRAEF